MLEHEEELKVESAFFKMTKFGLGELTSFTVVQHFYSTFIAQGDL